MDANTQCCATFETAEQGYGAKHYSMQRMVSYGNKRCTKKAKVQIGPLSLCTAHARMTREGLVDEHGNVASKSQARDVRKWPEKWPGGFYDWHKAYPEAG